MEFHLPETLNYTLLPTLGQYQSLAMDKSNLSINLIPILGGASFTQIYCLFMGSGNAKQDLTFFFYATWFFNELSVNLQNLWDLCAGCYGCCLLIGCCFYKAHVCPCSNGVQSSQMEGVCILLILVEARFIKYFYYPR